MNFSGQCFSWWVNFEFHDFRPFLPKVTKRDEDSSLMQLKEEFRTYEALRREHDSQIVQIAMEGGLRIAPDQWSSLLYGDQSHKSHMQSIIDKVRKKKMLDFLSHILMYFPNANEAFCRFSLFSSTSLSLRCSCRPPLLLLKVSRS